MWLISMPCAYLFTFNLGYGYVGIWMGLPCGTSLIAFSYFIFLIFAPYKEIAGKVSKSDQQDLKNLNDIDLS